MATPDEHIAGFCHAFLLPTKRERMLTLLSGRRRALAMTELAHPDYLDPRFATPWPDDDRAALLRRLSALGAGRECYILSDHQKIDGATMDVRDGLGASAKAGLATVISCVPGRLAFYEGEYGASERFILSRPAHRPPDP